MVVNAFDKHFKPRVNVVFERYKFNVRVQQPGESAETFITALHKLAESCEYAQMQPGQIKEELIRDRIVIGMADAKLSEQMQMKSELTLQQAVQMCRQGEIQNKESRQIRNAKEVNRVQIERRRQGRTTPRSSEKQDAGQSKPNMC